MKKYIFLFVLIGLCSFTIDAQTVTTGVFGGDASASNFSSTSNTYGKWLKVATMTLNGNWARGSLLIDFFPKLSAHGDSRQTLIVNMGNGTTGVHTYSNDIALITHYGNNNTVGFVRVVHESGSGVTNNVFAVWVKLGSSHVHSVPIEVRTRGNVNVETTNQPYYETIQDTGIAIYDLQSSYGKFGNQYIISSINDGDAVLKIQADNDNNDESDNARIALIQDGGGLGAYIGFNADWPVSGGDAGNLFRIVPKHSNIDKTDAFVINGQNGNVGISTSNPSEKLEVNGTIRSKEVKVEASPWPDYVFSSDYKLRSLAEIEAFIQANNHLPEVPPAEEVAENGIALGEMNALLLKKIEELTLHVIELKKENDSIIKRLKEIEANK